MVVWLLTFHCAAGSPGCSIVSLQQTRSGAGRAGGWAGQSGALQQPPGVGTGSDRTPVTLAGQGAARGLPCPQRSLPVPPRVAGCPKRTDGSGWAVRDDTSVNHFRATVHERSGAQPAPLRCQALRRVDDGTGNRLCTKAARPEQPTRRGWAGQERVPTASPPRPHAAAGRDGGTSSGCAGVGREAPSTRIPTAPHHRGGQSSPGRPAAEGLKCLVIPFIPGFHLFAG